LAGIIFSKIFFQKYFSSKLVKDIMSLTYIRLLNIALCITSVGAERVNRSTFAPNFYLIELQILPPTGPLGNILLHLGYVVVGFTSERHKCTLPEL
jgi:hypothetical protein